MFDFLLLFFPDKIGIVQLLTLKLLVHILVILIFSKLFLIEYFMCANIYYAILA